MCGRFGLATDSEGVLDYFWFDPSSVQYKQRYNVAPTDPVLTYGAQGPNAAEYMRWGLIPYWSKPGGRKLPLAINARAETIATHGMFKWPFQRRRCLVLSDGFYEWHKSDHGAVTPYLFEVSQTHTLGKTRNGDPGDSSEAEPTEGRAWECHEHDGGQDEQRDRENHRRSHRPRQHDLVHGRRAALLERQHERPHDHEKRQRNNERRVDGHRRRGEHLEDAYQMEPGAFSRTFLMEQRVKLEVKRQVHRGENQAPRKKDPVDREKQQISDSQYRRDTPDSRKPSRGRLREPEHGYQRQNRDRDPPRDIPREHDCHRRDGAPQNANERSGITHAQKASRARGPGRRLVGAPFLRKRRG